MKGKQNREIFLVPDRGPFCFPGERLSQGSYLKGEWKYQFRLAFVFLKITF
jgi:hypothetical protein